MSPTPPEEGSTRRAVLEFVRQYPGVHVRGVERALGISSALAQYHLTALADERRLLAMPLGGAMRYFPASGSERGRSLSPPDRKLLGMLRDRAALSIVLALLDHGPRTLTEIAKELGVARNALHYQLQRLVKARVLGRVTAGDETVYRVLDERRARLLLAAYQPTPDLRERFQKLWDAFYAPP